MARMHSRDLGKSGSTPPSKKRPAEWLDLKPKEIEEIIVKLANAGQTPAQIGVALRDQHGVPDVQQATGKRVSQVLAENNLLPDVPRDLLNLISKSVDLMKHMEENKKDATAKRGYQLTVSKIRRLAKYYKSNRKLAENWRYTPDQAKLLVK